MSYSLCYEGSPLHLAVEKSHIDVIYILITQTKFMISFICNKLYVAHSFVHMHWLKFNLHVLIFFLKGKKPFYCNFDFSFLICAYGQTLNDTYK